MYIWADTGGRVCITHSVKAPLANPGVDRFGSVMFTVPLHVFEGAAMRGPYGGDVRYRGLKVTEVYIFTKTGELVPDEPYTPLLGDRRRRDILIRLEYKGSFVHMFTVTWVYIVRNVIAQLGPKQRKRLKVMEAKRRERARALLKADDARRATARRKDRK